MRIGVVAWQGDFAKHLAMLKTVGIETQEVRQPEDLAHCAGLIIPGGESTVMVRQMDFARMRAPLAEFAKNRPLFGTCAGLILLAKEVHPFSSRTLELLDITVERNAFGRQAESFRSSILLELNPPQVTGFSALFIRAPRIQSYGPEVQILASFQGEPVLVRQGRHLAASFHPELMGDPAIHQYFISSCVAHSDSYRI